MCGGGGDDAKNKMHAKIFHPMLHNAQDMNFLLHVVSFSNNCD